MKANDEAKTITLPSFTSCFIEAINDPAQAGIEIQAALPNLKGWFGQLPSSSLTNGDNKLFKRTAVKYKTGPNDGTKGNKDRRMIFNANSYCSVYKDSCKTVQPHAKTMLIYYYVGPKTVIETQQGN